MFYLNSRQVVATIVGAGCMSAFFACSSAQKPFDALQERRAGEVVLLSGSTYSEGFFGPPNYGEAPISDSKENACILHLEKEMVFITSAGEKSVVQEIQLVGYDDLNSVVNKHQAFRGVLDEGESGHHRRPVILALK